MASREMYRPAPTGVLFRRYTTSWGTTLTCRIPSGRIALFMMGFSMFGIIWNNADGVILRAINMPTEAGANVTKYDTSGWTVTRDETDISLVTITKPGGNSTMQVLAPLG